MLNKESTSSSKENFHKMTLTELEDLLHTSIHKGLDRNNASQLLLKYGPNKIKQKKKHPFKKIFGYFFSGFGTLFFFAAILCILAWRPLGALGGNNNMFLLVINESYKRKSIKKLR
jgi:sodium/potassium-transporting ATPase subunit alpha